MSKNAEKIFFMLGLLPAYALNAVRSTWNKLAVACNTPDFGLLSVSKIIMPNFYLQTVHIEVLGYFKLQ